MYLKLLLCLLSFILSDVWAPHNPHLTQDILSRYACNFWTSICRLSRRNQKADLRLELSIVKEDAQLLTENKPASSKVSPPLDNSSLEKIKEEMREEKKKTPQSTVSPCVLCTSPFCFSAAAGPD